MRGKFSTLLFLISFCATATNAQGPLAKKEISGVNATGNVTVNATLDPAYILSGTITSNNPNFVLLSVEAESSAGNFFGDFSRLDNSYRIVVPAGSYNLYVTFELTTCCSPLFTSFTIQEPVSPSTIAVSADTIYDFAFPTVTTSSVAFSISGLNPLFSYPAPNVTFSSNTVPGFTAVSASAPVGSSGSNSVLLPDGTFTAQLTQTDLSFTAPIESVLTTNFGPSVINGPTTLNLTVPPVTTATLSGTVSFTGSPTIPSMSSMSAADVSGGTPPATISSGGADIGELGGSYSLILTTDRTYALNPTVFVPLLPAPAPLAIYTPPDPAPALLTENTTRNVTYPAVPGPSTGYTISGWLTITGTITPVANASVQALGENITGAPNTFFNSTTTSDAYGNYSIEVPAGTNYYLIFQGQFVTSGDFDGDGKADIGVFRPSNGEWYIIPSSNPGTALLQQWGTNGDIPVRGDFDGDGKDDFAVFRPSNGTWFVIPSATPSTIVLQQWGASGDIPVPGDYDGDGKTDFAVFRPSDGIWFIIPSSNPNSPIIQQWGTNGDIPVPGDYDGDGKTDIAVWRPSIGEWFIIPSSNPGSPILQQWGISGDVPVPGDYDGDGKTDFAIWRPSNGVWFIIPSSKPSSPILKQWGTSGDVPVPVDYDRDRKTDIAVWRPSNGVCFILPSSASGTFSITQWGASGDIPIQRPIGQ